MLMSVSVKFHVNKHVLILKVVSNVVVGVDIQLMAVDVTVGVDMLWHVTIVYVK